MRNFLRLLIFTLVLMSTSLPGFAQDSEENIRNIRFDRKYDAAVELSMESQGYSSFVIQVPRELFAFEILLKNAEADLDLFVRHGSPIENYGQTDASSSTELYDERLLLSRLSRNPLETGSYYIDVVYQGEYAPLREYRRMNRIPFEIEVRSIKPGLQERIRTGTAVQGELRPGDGMAKTFELELQSGVDKCRIDIFDADANLDILVGYEKPDLTRKNADYIGDSLVGNESLVFGPTSRTRSLPAGTYYITVYDAVQSKYPETFGIQVTAGDEPPERLLRIPRFPLTDDELQHSLHATVEVVGERGRGSGCIVTEEGMILTSWHVVRGYSGGASEQIIVASSLSPQSPPVELFRAELVDHDEAADLALLQVKTGLYGQDLPTDYEFPFLPLDDSREHRIGQPLSIIGYPGTGNAGSRISVSLSRGIISGFEKRGSATLIKTDAPVLPGTSGGAVINTYFELLGIPLYSVGETGGGIGYVYPVHDLPEDWKEMIRSRNNF